MKALLPTRGSTGMATFGTIDLISMVWGYDRVPGDLVDRLAY